MSWRSAFLLQARSDNEIRELLNRNQAPYAHQLHYLQMAWEKLAKGVLTPENAADHPDFGHRALVRCLQHLKTDRRLRRLLHYQDASLFTQFINSLLPLAEQIERLAPALAGARQPNPEYPWQTTFCDTVVAPVEFDFPQFNPRSPQMIKLNSFLDSLLRIVT